MSDNLGHEFGYGMPEHESRLEKMNFTAGFNGPTGLNKFKIFKIVFVWVRLGIFLGSSQFIC